MAKIDLAQFLGKPKTYEVLGQSIELEPLKGKDLDLLMGMKEGEEVEGVKKLIKKQLDLTDDEFGQLPVPFLNAITECILDVNGIKTRE